MTAQEQKPRDPELAAIGGRIRAARTESGLSREKLAELADTSPQFLSQVEKGEQSMTLLKFKRLAAALDISSDYLLFGHPPLTGTAGLAAERLAALSPVDRAFLSRSVLLLHRLLDETTPDHE